MHATLNSNSGRGSVTRIEMNGLRLVPPLGNLLLLGHICLACVSTVGITITEDHQLDAQAHTQHRPFQEMLKARGEGGVSLRSPNNQRSSGRTSSSSPRPRRLVSTRSGRHQRAQVTELREEHVGKYGIVGSRPHCQFVDGS